ncbi:MAG TPA: ribosome maturation factor RimM [Gammaproteobacteria bacterium]|nr:ribosome maturation factor RimM [Gammaproteobacteria bacterium]
MGQKSIVKSVSGVVEEDMVVLGRIGAPYGLKGWVHVQSYAEPASNILSYKIWYLKIKRQWQPVEVLDARSHSKSFVAALTGYETIEKVEQLKLAEIAVLRSELPALDSGEYYWSDLIGLSVVTEESVVLGQVERLIETGSNDVLVVKGGTREHLIPYILDDYVLSVDLKARVIRVSWDPEF